MENTMNKNVSSSIIDQEKGFTLIELCIVIIIIGVLVAPLLQLYHSYLLRKEMIVTRENVQAAVDGLGFIPFRYASPSNRSLVQSTPNFGLEKCDLAAIPLCSTAGLQGICRAVSAFDKNGDTSYDEVIIGGVPMFYYETYNLSTGLPTLTSLRKVDYLNPTNIIDSWNNKLTYAVTANITRPNRSQIVTRMDFKAGVISAINEVNGNPTAGISDNALFVVVSHGKDGQGAFNNSGLSNNNCSTTGRGENCDEDTTFMQGLITEGTGGTAPYTGPFDDISKFYIAPEGEVWRSTGTRNASNQALPHIRNMNTNNIGVNITAPTSKLDVGGTIRADSVRASKICDENGNNCFNPPTLFGSGMPISAGSGSAGVCDVGQVITGISGGQIQCGHPSFSVTPTSIFPIVRTCPAGKFIVSVITDGCIICNDGSKRCP